MKTLKKKSPLSASVRALAPYADIPDARAMLDALPDAVLLTDAAGHVVFSNHGAQAFFGFGERTLLEKTLGGLIGRDHPAARMASKNMTLYDIDVCDRPVARLSSVPFSGLTMIVLRLGVASVRQGWIDKTRAALKPAQHLARVLAHEIKNPLSGIQGAAQILAASGLQNDDRELAELIVRETQRIARLVARVGVLGIESGAFHLVNIHEVLDEVRRIALSGFARGCVIETHYDPSLPALDGDRDALVQVFLNLAKNAAEAGADKIILRSFYDTAAMCHPETGCRLPVCAAVCDNGGGVPASARAHLFDPGFTLRPAGEGLGLSIVSKIIDDHGGAIDMACTESGTTFKVSFAKGGNAT